MRTDAFPFGRMWGGIQGPEGQDLTFALVQGILLSLVKVCPLHRAGKWSSPRHSCLWAHQPDY